MVLEELFAGALKKTPYFCVKRICSEPFLYKTGSKEAGQKWTEVAKKLNCYDLFREMPRDQRSVRDQFNKLMGNYKRKRSMEEKSSGINPDPPPENEEILVRKKLLR